MVSKTKSVPEVEVVDLAEDIPAAIYNYYKEQSNKNFVSFVQSTLIRIGLNIQQFKPKLSKINDEEAIRDIVVIAAKQYCGKYVTAETFQNGKTDIRFEKPENESGSLIVECLRDDTYSGAEYKEKVEQVLGYRDLDEVIFLLTFVQNDSIDKVVANAKRQASTADLNPIMASFTDFKSSINDNYMHGFTSVHSSPPGKVTIKHIFYDISNKS